MIGFIEECRREWKRLGVPDPIANEMAVDLTADIEEAEAEGGSAEDVLGNSLFDPRRFAAAWASARGVTAPPASVDSFAPLVRERHPWYQPAIVVALVVFGFLTVLAAAALVIGRHGVAVAASIGRNVVLPGSPRFFGSVPATPSFRYFASGPSFSFQNAGPFAVLAFALLAVGIVVVGLAIVYRTSWFRRESKRRLW
jgi:hypothetical protein